MKENRFVTPEGTELRLCPLTIDQAFFEEQAKKNKIIHVLMIDTGDNLRYAPWTVTNWTEKTSLWKNIRTHHAHKALLRGEVLKQVFYAIDINDLPNIRGWRNVE